PGAGGGLGHRRSLGIGQAVVPHLRAAVHQPVAGDAVAPGHRIVVGVMRAGDLHRAGAEGRVGIFVGDDRDQPAMLLRSDWYFAGLADDWRVTFFRWVIRHRAVAQHGFRPRGGNGDVVAFFLEGDVPLGVLLAVEIGLAPRQRVFE